MNTHQASHVEMLSKVRLSLTSSKGLTYVVQAYDVAYAVSLVEATGCVCDFIHGLAIRL